MYDDTQLQVSCRPGTQAETLYVCRKFQLETLTINVIYGIVDFQEIIMDAKTHTCHSLKSQCGSNVP